MDKKKNKIINLPKATEDETYKAGYDCGVNGENTTNCHFKFFATKEKMESWQRGKKDAKTKIVNHG